MYSKESLPQEIHADRKTFAIVIGLRLFVVDHFISTASEERSTLIGMSHKHLLVHSIMSHCTLLFIIALKNVDCKVYDF